MTLASGTRLGSYEILSPLGAGGMGEVYRARDTRLMRDVAIKALPLEFARDPDRVSRFRREAQTLAGLNHPNIAAIYGLEDSGQTLHLVLELVDGETLVARLQRGPLQSREALALGIQVASAIEAAHERGIVHRDLKPGNVMLNAAGTAKVLDFGLAKSDSAPAGTGATTVGHAGATTPGVILGTVAYMSPEQARGKAVDRRSDVWSFGCLLYECFTGRPAFTGETVSDLIARILEREPEWNALPPSTPPRIREVLRRCLRKEVEDRPRDIRDVRLELQEIASGGGKAATSEKSIAVLPFENQSGPDDEYFADGVTDEILNALAQVDGLRVAARTSCFAFKGKREDLRAVGEKLDVTTVLEGTVRRSGPRLRITTQLVNAADGYQLWSERYDREMTDVFQVQDEIAGAIAQRLRVAIRGDAERTRAGTKNLEAYELLLRGRAFQTKRGRFMAQAIACFEKAIALDPEYAEPLAWLADSYRLIATFGGAPIGECMSKARTLAERALAIDPGQADALATLASVAELYDRDYPRSDTLYHKAFEMDSQNSIARAQYAVWREVRQAMPDEEALAQLRRAVADDPLNAWVGGMHSFGLSIAGRHAEGILEGERSVELDPESFLARWSLMRSYAWAGDYDRVIAMAPAILLESGRHVWALGLLAWTWAQAGRPDMARACAEELEARSRHEFVSPAWLSVAVAADGRIEEGFRYFERAVAEREPTTLWSRRFIIFSPLRAHPRYEEITRPLYP